MRVFEALLKEHNAFRRLAHRLRHSPDHDSDTAREELRACLLVLLLALERHELLEDEMFGEANPQHAAIDAIRLRLREALADSDGGKPGELGDLAKKLARLIVRHFDDEEKELWPLYKNSVGRSLDISYAKRAERHAEQLEREIQLNSDLVQEYLGRRK
jgi:hemerythrin-like domain-containing protein